MTNANFWLGKRVMVTGSTGFKGSWLTIWLGSLGAEVLGYSLQPPSQPSLFDAVRLREQIVQVTGDIRDGEKVAREMRSFAPEVVFHLAAQPLVRTSYEQPRETFETNVIGTLSVYEAVRSCDSVRSLISVTTDKCYENKEWPWGYRETDTLGGHDPYSASKACAELLSSAYRNSYFRAVGHDGTCRIGLATARAGNVIGGGDWGVDRLVPDTVRSIVEGHDVVLRNPHAIRPWQHVLEPLSGYLMLAQALFLEPGKYCGAWNFGPSASEAITVEQLVTFALRLWPSPAGLGIEVAGQPHETNCLRLDSSKARTLLGWKPRWNTEAALRQTVTWYKGFYSGDDMQSLSLCQIRDYEAAG